MSQRTNRPTVLLVDDDELAIEMLRAYLDGQRYQILTAYSGQEALAIIEREAERTSGWQPTTIDVILLDIMMPGIDGLKVCQRVKDDPALRHIPVIMITALSSSQDKVTAISFGADSYIIKPYLSEELISIVKASLKMKAQQDLLLRRLAELEALNAIAASAHHSVSFPLLVASTLTTLLEFQYIEAAAIYTLDDATGSLTLAQAQGPENVALPTVESCALGQGVTGWIGQAQQGRHIADISSHPEFGHRLRGPMRAYVGVALLADDRAVGVLEGFHRQPGRFDQRDVEWLEELGRQVGMAIENANIFESTQALLIQSSSLRQ